MRGLATFLHELGRRFQRIGSFLLLTALIGLPLAIIDPNHGGTVLLAAGFLALLVRVARHA